MRRPFGQKVEFSSDFLDISCLTNLGSSGRLVASNANTDKLGKFAAIFYLKTLLKEIPNAIGVFCFGRIEGGKEVTNKDYYYYLIIRLQCRVLTKEAK